MHEKHIDQLSLSPSLPLSLSLPPSVPLSLSPFPKRGDYNTKQDSKHTKQRAR